MNKGPDIALARIEQTRGENEGSHTQTPGEKVVDEIENYLKCRYVSASKACWRIFSFIIQYKDPLVQRLTFHLENQQHVLFQDHEHLNDVLERVGQKKTTLTEWMTANKLYAEARDLTYVDFPTEWRCDMLRRHQDSGGIIHPTYKAACHALELLTGDNEWHEFLHEAVIWATGTQLRNLFVTILLFCEVSDPKDLWEKHWEALSDDITHRQRQRLGIANLSLTKEQLRNYALYEIEKLLNRENRSLIDYHGIPLPDATLLQDSGNRMVLEEQSYDTQSLARNACDLENGLNAEQRNVYDNILEAVRPGLHTTCGDVLIRYKMAIHPKASAIPNQGLLRNDNQQKPRANFRSRWNILTRTSLQPWATLRGCLKSHRKKGTQNLHP
uniref:Uncharacterized protein n=1 Tax=Chenopodium quinoa TaxID=63459 RepID=A0A803KUF8_CHEQI